jgi:hypothetical protein
MQRFDGVQGVTAGVGMLVTLGVVLAPDGVCPVDGRPQAEASSAVTAITRSQRNLFRTSIKPGAARRRKPG